MKKNDNEVADFYAGKISIEERLMLLLTGIVSFPVGFALYFYFKDKDNYKYHTYFARIGAWTGIVICLMLIITSFMIMLASYLTF